jgi:SOS-response transcriptional repressor LexA
MCDFQMMSDMRPDEIVAELKRLKVPHEEIAKAIGRDRTAATKMLGGNRSVKHQEIAALTALVERYRATTGIAVTPPTPTAFVAPLPKDIQRRIAVVGDVEAGVWRETVAREAYEIEDYLPIDVQGYESARLKAWRVAGPSMNQLYPPGRFVVTADAADAGVRNGDHVIVERRRGSMTEVTLKEYVQEPDGRIALWPRSDHPDFQEPVYLKARDESDQDGATVIGVVVADYRRRERPPA